MIDKNNFSLEFKATELNPYTYEPQTNKDQVDKNAQEDKSTNLFIGLTEKNNFTFHSTSPEKINDNTKYKHNFIKGCLNGESSTLYDNIDAMFSQVIKLQQELRTSGHNEIESVPASLNNPQMYIFPKELYIVKNRIGSGAQSCVFMADRISSRGSPTTPRVLKLSAKSYSPEQRLLAHSNLTSSNIDHILDARPVKTKKSKLKSAQFIAIFKLSSGALKDVDFLNKPFSINFIVKGLCDIAEGIKDLHRTGFVHRDIKGENLLYNESKPWIVTDTGLLKTVPSENEIHSVNCTRFYAPPFIWQKVNDNVNQIDDVSLGHQGRSADVFSFGRVIQYDILGPFLNQISLKYDIDISSTLEQIMPAEHFIASLNDLSILENQFPNRVVSIHTKALVFPESKNCYEITLKAIQQLKLHLSNTENIHLKLLAKLAHQLQLTDPASLPNMDFVVTQLKQIAKIENQNSPSDSPFCFAPSYSHNTQDFQTHYSKKSLHSLSKVNGNHYDGNPIKRMLFKLGEIEKTQFPCDDNS